MGYTVHFLPMNQKIELEEPENLLKICSQVPVLLDGTCAGKGICGKCKVQILEGMPGPLTEVEKRYLGEEEIIQGDRLACQVEVREDLTVMISDLHGSSKRKKAMNPLPEGFEIHPAVEKIYKEIEDETYILWSKHINLLQKNEQKGRDDSTEKCNTSKICLAVEAGDTREHCYGLAVDIGTTTVVGILWNLTTGTMVDVEAATNPQSIFGADVISRIQYCMEGERMGEDHLGKMQKAIIGCINEMLQAFEERNAIRPEWIYDMTVVGNTTMCHLFLGLNPASLARYPFEPQYTGGKFFEVEKLGLKINGIAKGYVLPGIAGHVGADLTAVMLATDLIGLPGNHIAIDIGTNGEILVARDGEVLTCSTAAGPAFEGASIHCGMRAAKGAIERVEIDQAIHIKTIEEAEPVGICGSGLIDATAQLVSAGMIVHNGNLLTQEKALESGVRSNLAAQLYGKGRDRGVTLVTRPDGQDIVLTQKDIREVQLAKGAVLGGMKTLMNKIWMSEDEIDQIFLAGAFGSYIDKKNAIKMGLLPQISAEKVLSIGNAAGVGSSMALLSFEKRVEAETIVKKVQHVELSKDMEFQEFYIKCMNFS